MFLITVKEEAMKKGGWLLRFYNMPGLRKETSVKWRKGRGEKFEALCELLKGNAIPTKELDLEGE